MDLKLAILTLAAHLQADPAELESYAQEANALNIGGYHNSKGSIPGNLAPDGKAWQSGSVWAVEGAMLYMLARLTKALAVAEIGGFWGCSASWLVAAVKKNAHEIGAVNPTVYSVDSGILNAEHGSRIPSDLRAYVALVNAEGSQWLDQYKGQLDLIFSDASHDTETTQRIAKIGWMRLAAGGIWAEHDAMHDRWVDGNGNWGTDMNYTGAKVRAGLDAAALPYRNYLVEPSDCGLAIARKPVAKVEVNPVVLQVPDDYVEKFVQAPEISTTEPTPTPKKPTPKKTRAPRKAKAK